MSLTSSSVELTYDPHDILGALFGERGLVNHKFESYDSLLVTIPKIIRSCEDISFVSGEVKYTYSFGNTTFIPCEHTPNEARLKDCDYHLNVCVDITRTIERAPSSHTPHPSSSARVVSRSRTVKNSVEVFRSQKICHIPLMVKSKYCALNSKSKPEMVAMGECPYDLGGYYIINGKERCIVPQERIEYNRVYVWQPQKYKDKKSFSLIAEVRSVLVRGSVPNAVKVCIEKGTLDTTNGVVCTSSLYSSGGSVQAGVMLYAFGLYYKTWTRETPSKDVVAAIREWFKEYTDTSSEFANIVEGMLYVSQRCMNYESCTSILSQYASMKNIHIKSPKGDDDEDVLSSSSSSSSSSNGLDGMDAISEIVESFFVHVDLEHRLVYFVNTLIKLFSVHSGMRNEDDRDHFSNKRIDMDGKLFEDLFRGFLPRYIDQITMKLKSQPTNMYVFERETLISKGIHGCMSTGNWGLSKVGYMKKGVSQLLTRASFTSAVSHLRRVSSNRSIESRAMKFRLLHNSQYGHFDPCETPEGASAGILKNLALTSSITVDVDESIVRRSITRWCDDLLNRSVNCNPEGIRKTVSEVSVLLNGKVLGTTPFPGRLVTRVREMRRRGIVFPSASVSYKQTSKEVCVYTDSGRCIRPLLAVNPKTMSLYNEAFIIKDTRDLSSTSRTPFIDTVSRWQTLVSSGAVQFVDSLEENTSVVATSISEIRDTTRWCEIHPATFLGAATTIIPFSDHNQSPRNAYSANMTKQAVSVSALNYFLRFDTTSYFMNTLQRPLVKCSTEKYVMHDTLPTGMNCIVAIMCYTGYNQEDSIIFNRGALDRGMFLTTVYKTYTTEENTRDNLAIESIEPPTVEDCRSNAVYNFLKLDQEGIIKEGKTVEENDVIVHKIVRRHGKFGDRVFAGVVHRISDKGVVDKVVVTKNSDGNKIVKVRVAYTRSPIMGDKFASFHAQKGTVGIVLDHDDMPYTSQGIVPDMIINPHCIPSRMTIGQLLECVVGKYVSITGDVIDATPFSHNTTHIVDKIGKALKENGFGSEGDEVMSSGFTGETMKGRVFIGPTYYRRLKHMILDKLSCRAGDGPVSQYTRQPSNQGRKNGTKFTSLKFGTMETNALCSHGATYALNERLLHSSDKYTTKMCPECGTFSDGKNVCGSCGSESADVTMPFVYKLVSHSIAGLMVKNKHTLE